MEGVHPLLEMTASQGFNNRSSESESVPHLYLMGIIL